MFLLMVIVIYVVR